MSAAEAFRRSPAAASERWSNEWIYFSVVVAAWCFMPLVRRLLDWHNGFYNPVQISSIVPFLLTLPLAFVAFRPDRIARLTPALKLFAWIWFAAFGYGMLVAVAFGEMFGGVYEAVQYLVPMVAGIWLAGTDIEHTELIRRLARIVLGFGAVVACYGIAQFVNPAPWDALWIIGGQFSSMGNPVPFGLRIFSTLNSSGPAADFFALTILFSLPFCRLRRIWIWPFIMVLGAALLLTLVRESWIALIIGTIVYLCVSPRRFSTLPFIAIYAVALSFLVTALPLFLGAGQNSDVISARIATLNDVGHDSSALTRTSEINESIQEGLEVPFGEGLGQIGAASMMSGNKHAPFGNVLDSGYLARFLELGWLGFAGYIVVVFGSFGTMIARISRRGDRKPEPDVAVSIAAAAAMCAALLWADAAGDSHLGLEGFLFWLALGIGLRRLPLSQTGPQARRAATVSSWQRGTAA